MPRRLRADWRHEWKRSAHREALLTDWDKLNGKQNLIWFAAASAHSGCALASATQIGDEMFQDLRYGARMLRKHPAIYVDCDADAGVGCWREHCDL